MSPHRSAPTLKLASRIDKLLQRELDEGIAPQRMVADGLYARDVLLVCDALVGSELQSLASLFRKAAAADAAAAAIPQHERAGISSFFHSLFGPVSGLPGDSGHDAAPTTQPGRWFRAPMRPTAADYVTRAGVHLKTSNAAGKGQGD